MPDPLPGTQIPAAPVPAAAPVAPKPTASAPIPAAAPAPAKPAVSAPAAPPKPAESVPLAVLMEERDKRQALQGELEQLRNTVNQMRTQAPIQQPIPAPVQPQQNIKEEMDKLWQTDPRAAVERTVYLAAQWQDNINAQVDGEAAQLAAKYGDFNDYRDTAMRYVRALPLDQRARPGIVEMAYLVTRGQNVDTIIERQRAAMAQQFQTNPAAFQMPVGASAGSLVPASTAQASEAEERAARAMKIPLDQYLKWKK